MALKALSTISAKAIDRVLAQQQKIGIVPNWDSCAHRAALGYLAELFLQDGKFARKDFESELASEPWDYASNLKKRLAALGMIPTTEAKKLSIYA